MYIDTRWIDEAAWQSKCQTLVIDLVHNLSKKYFKSCKSRAWWNWPASYVKISCSLQVNRIGKQKTVRNTFFFKGKHKFICRWNRLICCRAEDKWCGIVLKHSIISPVRSCTKEKVLVYTLNFPTRSLSKPSRLLLQSMKRHKTVGLKPVVCILFSSVLSFCSLPNEELRWIFKDYKSIIKL